MTASQPQGAPNTAGSVSTDTATGPDPYRATQGERSVTYTDLLRMRALRDDRVNAADTCRCPMCRHVTGQNGSRGLVWSTLAASLDTERWAPSSPEVVFGD